MHIKQIISFIFQLICHFIQLFTQKKYIIYQSYRKRSMIYSVKKDKNMSERVYNPEIDELTGLFNRMSFYKHAQMMINENPEFDYCLIISDIDNFKIINARYGEKKGDELLSFVGTVLKSTQAEEILFGRFSGDQFVGLIRIGDEYDEVGLEPLFSGMDIMYKEAPVSHFEVKFGLYEYVDKNIPISMMCDRAIMALKTVKHQYGKRYAKYNQRMQLKFMKEQHIEECMEKALENNQFQVYYQPKHDCKTGQLVGAEALVRWIHPDYGFMSPGEFIPIFEKNGFISKMDTFVWRRVMEDLKEWKDKGIDIIPISINVSIRDLLHEAFFVINEDLKQINKVSTEYLHMEITESIFIGDIDYIRPIIEDIRNRNIKIELDDFGSGYSALSLLTSLPLDIIKLDRTFVSNLEKQKLIVESIIKICHGLGCKMIAEGVETQEQLDILTSLGCDMVQGYLFSKPLPHDGFEQYMKDYNR